MAGRDKARVGTKGMSGHYARTVPGNGIVPISYDLTSYELATNSLLRSPTPDNVRHNFSDAPDQGSTFVSALRLHYLITLH